MRLSRIFIDRPIFAAVIAIIITLVAPFYLDSRSRNIRT